MSSTSARSRYIVRCTTPASMYACEYCRVDDADVDARRQQQHAVQGWEVDAAGLRCPATMMSVAWPSTFGPSTVSVTLSTANESTSSTRARSGTSRRMSRRTALPKSFDFSAGIPAPPGRGPGPAGIARPLRPWARPPPSPVGRWSSCRFLPFGAAGRRRSRRRSAQVREQLAVGAEADALAVLEHQDLVGVDDRRHALGDDHHGRRRRCTGRARPAAGRRWPGRAPRTSRRRGRSPACARGRGRWPGAGADRRTRSRRPARSGSSSPPGIAATKSVAWATSSASHSSSSVASGLP